MVKRLTNLIALIVIGLSVGLAAVPMEIAAAERLGPEHEAGITRKETLVFGKASRNPKKHYRAFKPMIDYAVLQMKDLGIRAAKVLLAKDNRQLIRYLRQGKVDWVTETPFSAIQFEEQAGAEILLRRWKGGVAKYNSVFVTQKGSNIKSIADIKGRTIAFEDEGSTSSFLIPYYYIKKAGLELIQLETPRETAPSGKVGYIFAGQEINMTTWLHKRLIDAVAYSNLDWIKKDHTPAVFKKDFRIFYQTQSFPRAVEMVRKGIDPRIRKRLKKILTNVHKDPKAKRILLRYQKTSKFDELDGQAWAAMEEVRRIVNHLGLKVD